jgi:hypothetical protein
VLGQIVDHLFGHHLAGFAHGHFDAVPADLRNESRIFCRTEILKRFAEGNDLEALFCGGRGRECARRQ